MGVSTLLKGSQTQVLGEKGRAVKREKAVQTTNCTTGMEKGSLRFSQSWKGIGLLRAQILVKEMEGLVWTTRESKGRKHWKI